MDNEFFLLIQSHIHNSLKLSTEKSAEAIPTENSSSSSSRITDLIRDDDERLVNHRPRQRRTRASEREESKGEMQLGKWVLETFPFCFDGA